MALSASDFYTEDLSNFAKHMGLDGIDGDLFYETYYQIDPDNELYEDEEYREEEKYITY